MTDISNNFNIKKQYIMRLRFEKNVLGEIYYCYITFNYGSDLCVIDIAGKEKFHGKIIKKHIVFDKPIELVGKNWTSLKRINKIKIPKEHYLNVKEYSSI
jgi:glycine betaine/choline ABC-type transport system substrate-binding protein